MRLHTQSRRGFLTFVFFLAVLMGVVQAMGSTWKQGLLSFAIVFGFWLLISFIPWNGLELLQAHNPDERQGALGLEACAFSGIVMVLVALAGAMIDMAQGQSGDFLIMCVVGGASFLLASLALPRMRHRG